MVQTMKDLHNYCVEVSTEYPELKEKVEDLFQLAIDEIEAGESVLNEIAHCLCDIVDLIEDYTLEQEKEPPSEFDKDPEVEAKEWGGIDK